MGNADLKMVLVVLVLSFVALNTVSLYALFYAGGSSAVQSSVQIEVSSVQPVLSLESVNSINAVYTAREAERLALTRVAGRVISVDADIYLGRDVWNVGIEQDNDEFDVLVDMENGKVVVVEDD